jgi:hypothetical protein
MLWRRNGGVGIDGARLWRRRVFHYMAATGDGGDVAAVMVQAPEVSILRVSLVGLEGASGEALTEALAAAQVQR